MWFHKILVGVDFTPPSHEALRTATAFAADGGAELVLVHVLQPLVTPMAPVDFPGTLEHDEVNAAELALLKWQAEAEQVGAKRVSTKVVIGTPWHEIVELLRRDDRFDLAVVGTHGRTGLRHVLLGSVAERIVRHASCAVLVVRVRQ